MRDCDGETLLRFPRLERDRDGLVVAVDALSSRDAALPWREMVGDEALERAFDSVWECRWRKSGVGCGFG